jgi:mono/diheme cytochrome c family protein
MLLFVRLHLLLVVASLSSAAAVAQVTADAVNGSLDKDVLPILADRCASCHDDDVKKGDISFDVLHAKGDARHDIKLWGKVREQLRAGTMPPKSKPPLDPAARDALLRWIGSNEQLVLTMNPAQPGPARTRRLNREEYNNTLRDLLGIAQRPGDKFPADGAGGEGFSNNADTLSLSPLLMEKYLDAANEAVAEVWQRGDLKQRLLVARPDAQVTPDAAAERVLRPFLARAFRRPPVDAEVKALQQVFQQTTQRGVDWEGAMKVTMKAVLVSPKFLFIEEKSQPESAAVRPLDSHEMASRLSYFLWASMPDAELLRLASENKLQDDAVIEAQVRRMLADEKALAFTKTFAGQWLRFDEVLTYGGPDRRKFPEFNDQLGHAMYDEIFAFCDHLLRKDGRVLDCLDSDYTFVNDALAKLYGIPGVQGKDLRQVKFTDQRRGGLSTMAAILATTAYPQRTSPVLRGKWVLEQLLGTPPPPPPPAVGELPTDDRDLKEATLRQKLEAHRNKPQCSGCHTRLDPPGFALENFDPMGRWRDNENGKPLDTKAEMPGGRDFATPAEFRKLLMDDKALFVRNFCTRLLGYALGRGIELHDQPSLLRLEQTLRDNDYHCEPLIIAVAKNPLFRSRR